jgi:nucleosome binding factor SPN SPT16 subunit
MFLKNDQEDGELTSKVIERVNSLNFKVSEMQEFMSRVNKIKIEPEIKSMKVAASFTEWTFKKVIREIEDAIEQEAAVKHRKVANNADKRLEDESKIQPFLNAHGIEDSQYFEYPLPI